MAVDVDFRSPGEEVKETPFAQAATNREMWRKSTLSPRKIVNL